MTDEITVPSRSDSSDQFRQFLVGSGGPAFLRRMAQVTGAFEQLLEACRRQRAEMLRMVDVRLATLQALAARWEVLRPLLATEADLELLKALHAERDPRLRVKLEPTNSSTKLRAAIFALTESIQTFNRRWPAYLATVDLTAVNKLREGYNLYYVLEKECAVRSGSVARQGFRPLEMLTVDHLLTEFPALSVPSAAVGPELH
jgi:hypothetical protein